MSCLHIAGVKDTMKAARALVGYFTGSSQAAAALEHMCEALGTKPKKLVQDVATRWWSTYSMLASMVYLQDSLENLKRSTKFKLPKTAVLTAVQWEIVKAGMDLLRPFMEVQQGLEGEKYVSISLCIPYI